jgi:hypothetical protein
MADAASRVATAHNLTDEQHVTATTVYMSQRCGDTNPTEIQR